MVFSQLQLFINLLALRIKLNKKNTILRVRVYNMEVSADGNEELHMR